MGTRFSDRWLRGATGCDMEVRREQVARVTTSEAGTSGDACGNGIHVRSGARLGLT